MSTAILISGQLRTFAHCYPNQRWQVLRHFDDSHFFITVQAQPDAEAILAPLIADYGADHVHLRQLQDPDLTADLTPQLSAAFHLAPYRNAAPALQLLLQHWYQNEVWRDFCRSELACDKSFETIVRLRPDLWFHSCAIKSTLAGYYSKGVVWSPWWGRFGGINDRFAIMDPLGAFAYFTVYPQIRKLIAAGCPFHPESLVGAAIESAGVENFSWLATEFSTFRANGDMRPPEITPADVAHAALFAA